MLFSRYWIGRIWVIHENCSAYKELTYFRRTGSLIFNRMCFHVKISRNISSHINFAQRQQKHKSIFSHNWFETLYIIRVAYLNVTISQEKRKIRHQNLQLDAWIPSRSSINEVGKQNNRNNKNNVVRIECNLLK